MAESGHESTVLDLPGCVEHTLLSPRADREAFVRLCRDADEAGCLGVCVPSRWVSRIRAETGRTVVSVVGFPSGSVISSAKAEEARAAVEAGADELDMVADLGGIKSGLWSEVEKDIAGVVAAARPVKVILETGVLTEAELRRAAEVAVQAGASFLKTCSGFAPGAAEPEVVAFLRDLVGGAVRIKASGGIRTRGQAEALIRAGASRIGTSRGPELLRTRDA
ncbi:MAG: deoxyribose-phosphate aldolase [Myxococcota bacterium]